jgi:sulfide:quinone oxidoreductase
MAELPKAGAGLLPHRHAVDHDVGAVAGRSRCRCRRSSSVIGAGFDLKGVVRRIVNGGRTPVEVADATHEVVIIGGGAAGIAVAASLLARSPGSTSRSSTRPTSTTTSPAGRWWARRVRRGHHRPHHGQRAAAGVHWIKSAVAAFEPERDAVILDGCRVVKYQQLVVCPGLKLDWHGIEGLTGNAGPQRRHLQLPLRPGALHLAPGAAAAPRAKALFSQPPMPIKCAGAPQKAMYLSADHWRRSGVLGDIDIQFCNAGAVLFGVADYVPALMEYVKAYGIGPELRPDAGGGGRPGAEGGVQPGASADGSKDPGHPRVRHAARGAAAEGTRLHPGQPAGRCGRLGRCRSGHAAPQAYPNIYALGDVGNTPNAKTAARRASRRRWWRTTCWPARGATRGEGRSTTATAPAR